VTTLILTRHGETDWNRERRWQGQADTDLNEAGRQQARTLAARLAAEPVAAVYSSDLRRAYETATIVASPHGIGVAVDPRLREIDFGEWEGLTTPEIHSRYAEFVATWPPDDGAPFPGGETYVAMGDRVVAALGEIARRHPDSVVVVVLHGGPIRGALAHAAGISYGEQRRLREHVANCDMVRMAVQNGTFAPLD
jgi:broad specificity phosphatase PhoE